MKKLITLSLSILFLLSTIGCSDKNAVDVNKKSAQLDEITIAIREMDYSQLEAENNALLKYIDRFKYEKDIRVKFDVISSSNYDDYIKKLNTKLYLKDGPTLIFVPYNHNYSIFTEQGIGLSLKDKISNYNNIYDSLLDDSHCYVPIGVDYEPIALNKNVLDELGLEEPSSDWTKEDYKNIRETWLETEPRCFTRNQYLELIYYPLLELEIIDESNKEVTLNNSQTKALIQSIREEIYSGKYILNPEYTFENYYNMLTNSDSDEYQISRDYDQTNAGLNYISHRYFTNPLRSIDISFDLYLNTSEEKIVLPYLWSDSPISVWGFIVNRNGKNTEIGLEFINGLLSDEIQLDMFQNEDDIFYPVNKNIEDEIVEIEKERDINEKSIILRKSILEHIKKGTYSTSNQEDVIHKELAKMMRIDFAKFIFADEPHTDEELSQELQKLEDEYQIWLNE